MSIRFCTTPIFLYLTKNVLEEDSYLAHDSIKRWLTLPSISRDQSVSWLQRARYRRDCVRVLQYGLCQVLPRSLERLVPVGRLLLVLAEITVEPVDAGQLHLYPRVVPDVFRYVARYRWRHEAVDPVADSFIREQHRRVQSVRLLSVEHPFCVVGYINPQFIDVVQRCVSDHVNLVE